MRTAERVAVGDVRRLSGDRGGSDAGTIVLVIGGIMAAWLLYAAGSSWLEGKAASKMGSSSSGIPTVAPSWSTPSTMVPLTFAPTTIVVPGGNQTRGGFPTPAPPSR